MAVVRRLSEGTKVGGAIEELAFDGVGDALGLLEGVGLGVLIKSNELGGGCKELGDLYGDNGVGDVLVYFEGAELGDLLEGLDGSWGLSAEGAFDEVRDALGLLEGVGLGVLIKSNELGGGCKELGDSYGDN